MSGKEWNSGTAAADGMTIRAPLVNGDKGLYLFAIIRKAIPPASILARLDSRPEPQVLIADAGVVW